MSQNEQKNDGTLENGENTPVYLPVAPPHRYRYLINSPQTRQQLIDSNCNPALRQKLQEMERWAEDEYGHTIRRHYQIGLMAKEIYEDVERNDGRTYGQNAMLIVGAVIDGGKSFLYNVLNFAQTFTPEEVEALCALRNVEDRPLSWSHARLLGHIVDPAVRNQLLERTVANAWTVEQMADEVKRLIPAKPSPPRLRRPPAPRNFQGVLTQQQTVAEKFLDCSEHVWEDRERGLLGRATELEPEEVTPSHIAVLKEHADQLERVAQKAKERAREARKVLERFAKILAEREARIVNGETNDSEADADLYEEEMAGPIASTFLQVHEAPVCIEASST